tara:strand:- start:1214 stop:2389 length:1176 start_codon:yes stop_codon:yes gene_type:complete
MATHDYVLANQSGSSFRTDLNNALAAIVSINSSSSEPSTKYAYMLWADTTNNVIKLRNSANNAWLTLFTTAGGIDVDAASNFNEDVIFTGASANVTWDKSEDDLIFNDNAKAAFGTGSDLTIYHNGNDSFITHTLAGSGNNLHIEAANSIQFGNVGTAEVLAQMIPNGACTLWYDNSKKFETDDDGVQVTGMMQAHKNISDAYYKSHAQHVVQTDADDIATFIMESSANSTPYGAIIAFTDASPDGNTRYFLDCVDSTARRMVVFSDGDVWTSDAGTLTSDETLKENIVDATPKLEDLKKLKVRNFNWKSSFHPEKSKQKQLGFIAQEVEEVFPALVAEYDVAPHALEEDHVPVMKKSIKQAWDPIIIKAMQELIAKVETLETKVAALEGS